MSHMLGLNDCKRSSPAATALALTDLTMILRSNRQRPMPLKGPVWER